MKLSEPSNFETPHLIYDPVRKDALVVVYDELIMLPGPFATYDEARAVAARTLDEKHTRVTDPPRRAVLE